MRFSSETIGVVVHCDFAWGTHQNAGFWRVLALFWSIFGPFCTVFPKNCPKNVKTTCKKTCIFWFPTGSRRVPDSQNPVPIWGNLGVKFQGFGSQKNALFRAETGWNQTKPFPISRLFGNFPVGLTLRKGLKSAPFLRPKRIPKTEKKGAT